MSWLLAVYLVLKNSHRSHAQGTDTWLVLLCRFSAQYAICFAPSPEEASIIVRSQELWADVVRYDPINVQLHVVSDSTLVWRGKS